MIVPGARPRSPRATSMDHVEDLVEAVLEGRPVLEVDGAAQALGSRAIRGPQAPEAIASFIASKSCRPGG